MDYYKILNLTPNASLIDIKQSYNKLVLKWHPDKNLNNLDEATIKFKELNDAYSILINPNTKKIYDKNCDIQQIEQEIFLTFDELYFGVSKKIIIDQIEFCDNCNNKCTICIGKGFILKNDIYEICTICNGNGILETKNCKCNGKNMNNKQEIIINIPKGVYNGYIIEQNDKKFIIKELRSNIFKHNFYINNIEIGLSDLYYELHITFIESFIGFHKVIDYFNEKLDIIIKEPVRHNDIVFIKQKGMYIIDENKIGNLYIRLIVEHPKELNLTLSKQQKIYQILMNMSLTYENINKKTNVNFLEYNENDEYINDV